MYAHALCYLNSFTLSRRHQTQRCLQQLKVGVSAWLLIPFRLVSSALGVHSLYHRTAWQSCVSDAVVQ